MDNKKLPRISIVNKDKCKPKKCALECIKKCPINQNNKMCIEVTKESKYAIINDKLCIGCNMCVKVCPFNAIKIINIPQDIDKDIIHQYGPNQFRLHRLPTPRPNQVLGLVGSNALGKSTAIKILAGKMLPNLGVYDKNKVPTIEEIIKHFRGSELQNYFTKLIENNLKPTIKPQYVDLIPKAVKGQVGIILNDGNEKNNLDMICSNLDLNVVLNRQVNELSGGELQRFAIAMVCNKESDVYLFDEPSSYLDIKQRINAALTIRTLIDDKNKQNYVIVVEHDLSVLDYLSDYICVLWGSAGAYGVVTMPYSVREGINIFLSGFIPTENLKFRDESLSFKVTDNVDKEDIKIHRTFEYPNMTKTLGDFKLEILAGSFTNSEILVMLGENGVGKTTFIKLLSGHLKPDNDVYIPELNVSYKPQKITPTSDKTVRGLLFERLGTSWQHPQFQSDVFKPMMLNDLLDHSVKTLSGGEIQRVAIVLCLGKPADIYLIDEPSAYLDSEQRIIVAKLIKRFILNSKKTAFIVEHDFIMSTYLADRVIVYTGKPSISCTASPPQSLLTGMNQFLSQLNITFRRDNESHRPRINKLNSQMDTQQKINGTYFHIED